MPAKLSTLKNKESQVTVHWDDEPIILTINRAAITTKFLRDLGKTRGEVQKRLGKEATKEEIDTEDSFESGFRQIETIVTKWDVVDDEGQPAPFNREVLEGLDLQLLEAMITAIWEKIRPNKPKSEGSFS